MHPESLEPAMIATCGMNCGLCIAHLRDKNRCSGCNAQDGPKANHCSTCRLKHCDKLEAVAGEYCFECAEFPCARMRQLDKRYRTKYRMSMIENLERIQERGIEDFVASEKVRWTCPGCGGIVCVHRDACIFCGQPSGSGRLTP